MSPKPADDLRRSAEVRLVQMPPAAPEIAADELLHEFQVYQIELEMMNDEMRRALSNLNADLVVAVPLAERNGLASANGGGTGAGFGRHHCTGAREFTSLSGGLDDDYLTGRDVIAEASAWGDWHRVFLSMARTIRARSVRK